MKVITAYEWTVRLIEEFFPTEMQDSLIRNISPNVNGNVLVEED